MSIRARLSVHLLALTAAGLATGALWVLVACSTPKPVPAAPAETSPAQSCQNDEQCPHNMLCEDGRCLIPR